MSKMPSVLGKGVAFVMVALFIYGAVFYIDGPFHPCGHQFCGMAHLHTADEYHNYLIWQSAIIAAWAIGIPTLLVLWLWEKIKR